MMANYIDILVTKDGYFCSAPPWEVKEGDLVYIAHEKNGASHEVLSVATVSTDSDVVTLVEAYIGVPLPRIAAKYHKSEVVWNDVPNDR